MGVKTRNLGNSEGKDIQWQAPLNADGSTIFNLEAGKGYFLNTTGGVIEAILPSSPSIGDTIAIVDFAGTFDTNQLNINLNGEPLAGSDNPSGSAGNQGYVAIQTENVRLELVYTDSTTGWIVFENEAKSSPTTAPFAAYINATGGTVTTSGDHKIHTFTGDSTFVVSSLGNPAGGGDTVDYLVVAGGGSGGVRSPGNSNGGGGAGGMRYSATTYCSPTCAPAHPRRSTTALTMTATTFPVTVGGGGAGRGPTPGGLVGNSGSNSVFSTITSTGGGFGGAGAGGIENGGNGGSGGGAGGGEPGGSDTPQGNTPPVSPSQGSNGGTGGATSPDAGAGGGGGMMQAGTNSANPGNGPGGAGGGIPNAFGCNGTPSGGFRFYSAGGGAGNHGDFTAGNAGTGGTGFGAGAPGPAGNPSPTSAAKSGAANTGHGGGGGGAGGGHPFDSGSGGKGIVVIRYKISG